MNARQRVRAHGFERDGVAFRSSIPKPEDIGHAAASNFRILFDVATECPNVPAQILIPRNVWSDKAAYEAAAKKLAGLFTTNFTAYDGGVSAEVKAGGPVAPV